MIEEKLYKKIESIMPITSVEAIIVSDDDKILVFKRNNPPVKEEWWFVGGRVLKGETLQKALIRKVKEETGLDITKALVCFVGVYTRLFPERHDITIAYLCKHYEHFDIKLNDEHSEFKFLSTKEALKELHPELQGVVKDAISSGVLI